MNWLHTTLIHKWPFSWYYLAQLLKKWQKILCVNITLSVSTATHKTTVILNINLQIVFFLNSNVILQEIVWIFVHTEPDLNSKINSNDQLKISNLSLLPFLLSHWSHQESVGIYKFNPSSTFIHFAFLLAFDFCAVTRTRTLLH